MDTNNRKEKKPAPTQGASVRKQQDAERFADQSFPIDMKHAKNMKDALYGKDGDKK